MKNKHVLFPLPAINVKIETATDVPLKLIRDMGFYINNFKKSSPNIILRE
jgi:hypothetical protein